MVVHSTDNCRSSVGIQAGGGEICESVRGIKGSWP